MTTAPDEVLYPPLPTAATPQPPPRAGQRVVLDDLVELLRQRSEFGERKYGTKLETFDGRDPYLDALQELLDLFVYLHQAQLEKAELEQQLAKTRASLGEFMASERKVLAQLVEDFRLAKGEIP